MWVSGIHIFEPNHQILWTVWKSKGSLVVVFLHHKLFVMLFSALDAVSIF